MKGSRKTVTIDDDIAIRIAELRRERNETLRSVVNSLLRTGLRAETDCGTKTRFVVRSKPLGTPRLSVDFDKIGETLDFLEAAERSAE